MRSSDGGAFGSTSQGLKATLSALVCSMATLNGTASAATPEAPSAPTVPSPQTIERVDVRTAAPYDPRRDDTASRIVVGTAEIMRYGDSQLLDVMKRLPGVTVVGNTIQMRGLGAGYTQILVDGARPPPGFALEDLPPSAIERIEIIRSSLAEYSAQGIAGTINIVLAKSVQLIQRELRLTQVRQSGGLTNVSIQATGKVREDSYSFRAWGSSWDEWVNSESEELQIHANPFQHLRSSRMSSQGYSAGSLSQWIFARPGGNSLRWQIFLNSGHFTSQTPTSVLTESGIRPLYERSESNDDQKYVRWRNVGHWTYNLPDAAILELKTTLLGARFDRDNRWKASDANDRLLYDQAQLSTNQDRTIQGDAKLTWPWREGHLGVAGVEWQRDRSTSDQREVAFDPLRRVILKNATLEATVTRVTAFAQNEWSITEPTSVYLGLRAEQLRTEASSESFANFSNRATLVSPIVQTLHKFRTIKGLQWRVAYARTFRAPQLEQMLPRVFASVDNSATRPDDSGNPALRPQRAHGVDLSLERFWDDGRSIGLTVNTRSIKDVVITATQFEDARWISTLVNRGKANTWSLEAESKWPVKYPYGVLEQQTWRFSLGRHESRVLALPEPDNRIDSQPKVTFSSGVDWRLRASRTTVGANVSYASARRGRLSVSETTRTDSTRNLDAYVLWPIRPGIQLRVQAENLLRDQPRTTVSSGNVDRFLELKSVTRGDIGFRASLEFKL
jgi:outer membrane receptor for ferrienterochelin and colicins